MKQLHKQIEKTYKKCSKHPLHEYSKFFYQKKVEDEKGIKYFINCIIFGEDGYDNFEFETQLSNNGRYININTVCWTNDPKERRRPYPKLKEVEDMFEKLWVAYGSCYYETF